jgi:hypothetical protein
MLRPTYLIPIVLFLFIAMTACDRVKRKGKQAVDWTSARVQEKRSALHEKKENLGDKIIARFDSDQPDTRFNKKRFSEFFGFQPTADVKDLYCYGDGLGIDSKYQFSFSSNTVTIDTIVSRLQLTKKEAPDNISRGLWTSFPWWDSAKIVTIKPYYKGGEHDLHIFLWVDSIKHKAYFIEYDM